MKILITGGAGYLGAVLVPALLLNKHDVTVLDLFLHGENSLAASCVHPGLAIVNGDCRDQRILHDLVKKADVVIALAAVVGASACERDLNAAHWTNTHAIRLLRYELSKSQRLIFPMTNSGYGIGGQAECDESSPLKPVSFYGRSKVAAEEEVLRHENAVSLRFATLFGASPRMRTDLMVNDFVLRAVRDRAITLFEPHFRRNFLHVRDAAYAIEFMAETVTRGTYNVGDSRANMTKFELCGMIRNHVPDFSVLIADHGADPDRRDYVISNAKIEAAGWHPQYTIDLGIDELIKLYQGLLTNRYGNA